jgi:hypothetical protein
MGFAGSELYAPPAAGEAMILSGRIGRRAERAL